VTIGVVGKYVGLPDAYKSLTEALVHGGIANRVKVNIKLARRRAVRAARTTTAELEPMHGILVPGGFGERGSEGKIASSASPASARCPSSASASACRWPASRRAEHSPASPRRSSTEFGDTPEPVVGLITEWMSAEGSEARAGGDLGGTMRLGAYEASWGNSHVAAIYGATEISERHRHRYEVNVHYKRRAGEGRPGLQRHVARRRAARDRRAARPSLVHRRAVPPGAEEPPFDPHPLFASFIEAARAEPDRSAQGLTGITDLPR
jgi:CTP synthase